MRRSHYSPREKSAKQRSPKLSWGSEMPVSSIASGLRTEGFVDFNENGSRQKVVRCATCSRVPFLEGIGLSEGYPLRGDAEAASASRKPT